MAKVSFKSHGQTLRFLKLRDSGALVRILRIYTRILRTLWAGVSGDIPGVSGLDLHQHIFFFQILSSLILILVIYLGMVRPRAGESLEDAEQRRQKRRHDPHTQREDAPRNPPRELRPRHRAGKEPAGSSSKEPRKAPYILQSRAAAPPSRPTPTSKGIAHDICPKTPPRLVVEYPPGQRTYPNIPRLHRPGIVPGFTVEMERNYYK